MGKREVCKQEIDTIVMDSFVSQTKWVTIGVGAGKRLQMSGNDRRGTNENNLKLKFNKDAAQTGYRKTFSELLIFLFLHHRHVHHKC